MKCFPGWNYHRSPSVGALSAGGRMHPRSDTMDKKLVSLLGAVATLAMMDAVQAAPEPTQNSTEILKASSFDELLKPIPNATHLLRAIDESGPAKRAETTSDVQVAQF